MAYLITGWIPKPGTNTRGSGKTGGMVWKLHQEKLRGRRVLTNFETVFNDDILTANMLRRTEDVKEFLRGAAIGTTEVHQFLESRNTQSRDQISTTYTISLFRKLRCPYHWDSQAVHKVEKRLIDETDLLVHCENLGCAEMDCRDRSCGIETCGLFHYEVFDRRRARFLDDFYLNGPRDFYHLFDSEEIVMDFVRDEEND